MSLLLCILRGWKGTLWGRGSGIGQCGITPVRLRQFPPPAPPPIGVDFVGSKFGKNASLFDGGKMGKGCLSSQRKRWQNFKREGSCRTRSEWFGRRKGKFIPPHFVSKMFVSLLLCLFVCLFNFELFSLSRSFLKTPILLKQKRCKAAIQCWQVHQRWVKNSRCLASYSMDFPSQLPSDNNINKEQYKGAWFLDCNYRVYLRKLRL